MGGRPGVLRAVRGVRLAHLGLLLRTCACARAWLWLRADPTDNSREYDLRKRRVGRISALRNVHAGAARETSPRGGCPPNRCSRTLPMLAHPADARAPCIIPAICAVRQPQPPVAGAHPRCIPNCRSYAAEAARYFAGEIPAMRDSGRVRSIAARLSRPRRRPPATLVGSSW